MIDENKYNKSLYVIHLIIVRARFMAYNKEPYEKIARLLDYAELLPKFLASEINQTDEFRNYIVEIGELYPECRYILDIFNDDSKEYNW